MWQVFDQQIWFYRLDRSLWSRLRSEARRAVENDQVLRAVLEGSGQDGIEAG